MKATFTNLFIVAALISAMLIGSMIPALVAAGLIGTVGCVIAVLSRNKAITH